MQGEMACGRFSCFSMDGGEAGSRDGKLSLTSVRGYK